VRVARPLAAPTPRRRTGERAGSRGRGFGAPCRAEYRARDRDDSGDSRTVPEGGGEASRAWERAETASLPRRHEISFRMRSLASDQVLISLFDSRHHRRRS
jgi:hypothetical protein